MGIKIQDMPDSVIEYYKKQSLEELNKMYPGIDTKDKFILFIKSELWFPFWYETIEGEIEFISNGTGKSYKSKIRTPYPNKNIKQISMVKGRRVCDYGIPILFDTFEELYDLEKVSIKWKITHENDTGSYENIYVQTLYDCDFVYDENKRIYSLQSRDTIPPSYKEEDESFKYIDRFDDVVLINSESEGVCRAIGKYLNKKEYSDEKIKEIVNAIILEAIGSDEIEETDEGDIQFSENFSIYYYYSKMTLEPCEIPINIIH